MKFKIVLKLIPIVLFIILLFNFVNCSLIKDNGISNLNSDLSKSNDEYFNININNISLNHSGPIEIGQSLEITINYTINCSSDYAITQNWVDLDIFPLNYTNLAFPCENNIFTTTVFIDPERFNPDPNRNYTGISNIYYFCENGSSNGIGECSQEEVQILKAELETELTSSIPDLIFSNEKLEISHKIFNQHNRDLVFKNQEIFFELYDSELTLIQNGSQLTDSEGILSITLDFEKGIPGTHQLHLLANNLNDYQNYFYSIPFNVLDINSYFDLTIENESALYVSTYYDSLNTRITLESNYDGVFNWNTSEDSGNFIEINSSRIFEAFLNNPERSSQITIDVNGFLVDFNKSMSISKNLSIIKRPLNLTYTSIEINNYGEIETRQEFSDSVSNNKSYQFDFTAEYYINLQNHWFFLYSSKDTNGLIQSKIKNNSFTLNNMTNLALKVKVNNNAYFIEQEICNLSIPKILVNHMIITESSTSNKINGTIYNENLEYFPDQKMEVIINNQLYKEISSNINGSFSFEFISSNFNDKIYVLLVLSSNSSYVPFNYYITIQVQPNEIKSLISNSGLLFSIFLVIPFCALLIQSQKRKNKMINLKI